MNRQSKLMVLQNTPLHAIAGYSKDTWGNYINCTYVNKGKQYPYNSRPKCLRRTGSSSPPSSSTLGSLLTRLGAASGMARSSTAATPPAT